MQRPQYTVRLKPEELSAKASEMLCGVIEAAWRHAGSADEPGSDYARDAANRLLGEVRYLKTCAPEDVDPSHLFHIVTDQVERACLHLSVDPAKDRYRNSAYSRNAADQIMRWLADHGVTSDCRAGCYNPRA